MSHLPMIVVVVQGLRIEFGAAVGIASPDWGNSGVLAVAVGCKPFLQDRGADHISTPHWRTGESETKTPHRDAEL